MDKIKNLSIRKTIVLYTAINLFICFFLSALIVQMASNVQYKIWWKYVEHQEKYFEISKSDGMMYIADVARPSAYKMSSWDLYISEACDFLQTYTILIVSIAGSIIAITIFYKHKLKKPIEELELASRKIGENNLDFHITYTNRDEMGTLCQEFERMRSQLAENNRKLWKTIEEQKALRAAITHDIRSPLSVLEGYQEMLMESLSSEEVDIKQAVEMVAESRKQIERMDVFVETMRKLSSLDSRNLKKEEITYEQLESDIQAELQILEKKYYKKCYLKGISKDKYFSGDKEVILEVVDNLLLNALRYAKTEVEIILSLSYQELKVSVTDDGVGFIEDREKVTKLFYQKNVKDSIKHAGMGMYISRLFCEKHGGELIVENSEDRGASITAIFHRIA